MEESNSNPSSLHSCAKLLRMAVSLYDLVPEALRLSVTGVETHPLTHGGRYAELYKANLQRPGEGMAYVVLKTLRILSSVKAGPNKIPVNQVCWNFLPRFPIKSQAHGILWSSRTHGRRSYPSGLRARATLVSFPSLESSFQIGARRTSLYRSSYHTARMGPLWYTATPRVRRQSSNYQRSAFELLSR